MSVRWMMMVVVDEFCKVGDSPYTVMNYSPTVSRLSVRVKGIPRRVLLRIRLNAWKGVIEMSVRFHDDDMENLIFYYALPVTATEDELKDAAASARQTLIAATSYISS